MIIKLKLIGEGKEYRLKYQCNEDITIRLDEEIGVLGYIFEVGTIRTALYENKKEIILKTITGEDIELMKIRDALVKMGWEIY